MPVVPSAVHGRGPGCTSDERLVMMVLALAAAAATMHFCQLQLIEQLCRRW